MKEIIEQLGKTFPFSVLTKKELEQLAEDASAIALAQDESLFQAHSPSDGFYLVVSGGIKLIRNNPGQGRLILEFFGPGELVLEEGLFENTAHSSEARPIGAVKLLKIGHKAMRKFLESNANFTSSWFQLASARLNCYRERLESLVFMDVERRLAGALLLLGKKFGKKDDKGTMINLKVTHQDLSEYVAASRETVSLALGDLRRKKLLQAKMRWLVIPDLKALRKRAEN